MMRLEKKNQITADFIDYVYQHVSFLVSVLPDKFGAHDLNQFFEKMNSAGRQLTPVEQIKGRYFPACSAVFDACLNFETRVKYEDIHQSTGDTQDKRDSILGVLNTSMEEGFGQRGNSTVEVSRSVLTPEIFLLHALVIASKRIYSICDNSSIMFSHDERTVLKQFNEYVGRVSKQQISPDEVLKSMIEYRKFLDDNIIFLRNASDGALEYWFREEEKAETESPRTEEENQQSKQRKMMKQLQAMLYVSSSNWQQWVLDAYFAQKEGLKLSVELLKKQDEIRHPQPSSIKENMNYYSIDRYWFWKLDYILWEKYFLNNQDELFYNLKNNEKNAVAQYRFVRNRSIEHLHPQTDGDLEGWKEKKHQFGNLAMISSSFNSTQQNDTVGVKFARLKDTQIPQKSLESIKMLLMFAAAEGQESEWTPE